MQIEQNDDRIDRGKLVFDSCIPVTYTKRKYSCPVLLTFFDDFSMQTAIYPSESFQMDFYLLQVFAVISVLCFERIIAICPTVYGEQPCLFTPAPPGKTPSCARPGLTYCEHPSNYPG